MCHEIGRTTYNPLLHKCKSLCNKGLYVVRQYYFQYKDDNTVKYKYINYYSLEKKLRTENDPDYRALPAPVAQQVLMMVDQNFKSFFNLLNKKGRGEYSEKVRIPKYLDKEGMFMAVFPTTAFSQKWIKQGIVNINGAFNIIRKSAKEAFDVSSLPGGRGFWWNPVRISV